MCVKCACAKCKNYHSEKKKLKKALSQLDWLYRKKCLGEPVTAKQIIKIRRLVDNALKGEQSNG